jgi:secretion/DNA translocation related TadE-like protein
MNSAAARKVWVDERGSGSLLGLAIIGFIVAIALVSLPLYIGLATKAALSAAADSAALAGADVAEGITPGIPCVTAELVATSNRAIVSSCRVDGLVVTVRARRSVAGLELVSSATAGPPGAVTN